MAIQFDLDQRVGDPFIKRPAFRVGTKFIPALNPASLDFPIKKRVLDVEGRLRRKNFQLTGPTPKFAKTIEEIEAMKTKQQGIKVRLGVGQFEKIRVGKRDKDGKLIKDEEGNTIFEMVEFDLSVATLPLQDRMDILTDIFAGGMRNVVGAKLDQLGFILGSIFNNDLDIANLTRTQSDLLAAILESGAGEKAGTPEGGINMDPTIGNRFSDLEDNRLLTRDEWKANSNGLKGRVNAFLKGTTNFDSKLTSLQPFFGVRGKGNIPASLSSLGIVLGNTRTDPEGFVLDLVSRKTFRSLQLARDALQEPATVFSAATTSAAADIDEDEEKEQAAKDLSTASSSQTQQTKLQQLLSDPSSASLEDLTSAIAGRQSLIPTAATASAAEKPVTIQRQLAPTAVASTLLPSSPPTAARSSSSESRSSGESGSLSDSDIRIETPQEKRERLAAAATRT